MSIVGQALTALQVRLSIEILCFHKADAFLIRGGQQQGIGRHTVPVTQQDKVAHTDVHGKRGMKGAVGWMGWIDGRWGRLVFLKESGEKMGLGDCVWVIGIVVSNQGVCDVLVVPSIDLVSL
ncbi:hypothetical protein G6F68_017905 [Rhizopus microsporus]|nr:hypothetical protein G6F68_017905 [Rhizopus microsporus]